MFTDAKDCGWREYLNRLDEQTRDLNVHRVYPKQRGEADGIPQLANSAQLCGMRLGIQPLQPTCGKVIQ